MQSRSSAKRERVRLDAWIKEKDFEYVVDDPLSLADELIEALARHDALSICIAIGPMACSRRRAVDRDTEMNRTSARTRSEHKMKIPCVKAVDDCPIRLV